MADAATAIELDGQYRALREGAGWLARERGVLLVTGPEAADYLQGQLTNDIEALAPDQGCYAALLDRKGHITADTRCLRLGRTEGDRIWLDAEPAAADPLLKHLQMYKIGREVEVSDAGGEWAITSLIGPASAEIAGCPPPAAEYSQRCYERDGIEILAVATDLGLDLITRPGSAGKLREALSGSGAEPISEEAAEIARVESGRPRFGLDFGTEAMPAEAGIVERAVNFEKGCYIGQEPVARLHYKGRPNRTLRGLRLSAPAASGDALRLGDRDVGTVGSACVSPALGPIGLAIVRREAGDGDRLTVGETETTAEVVQLPFRT